MKLIKSTFILFNKVCPETWQKSLIGCIFFIWIGAILEMVGFPGPMVLAGWATALVLGLTALFSAVS